MRAFYALWLIGCVCGPAACKPAPQHFAPAAIVPPGDGGSPCERACAVLVANHEQLAEAGCWTVTDAGPCARVCLRDQQEGVASQLDPDCVNLAAESGSLSRLIACRVCLPKESQ